MKDVLVTNEFRWNIREEELSDGSKSFDIVGTNREGLEIVMCCTSKEVAWKLLNMLTTGLDIVATYLERK